MHKKTLSEQKYIIEEELRQKKGLKAKQQKTSAWLNTEGGKTVIKCRYTKTKLNMQPDNRVLLESTSDVGWVQTPRAEK